MSKNFIKFTNNETSLVIEKIDEPIVKDDLKTMYQLISDGQIEKVVINNSNLSKDALTNVYLDKLTSSDELLKLKEISFNNIKTSEGTIPPYTIISMFTRVLFLSSNRLVNLTILELKDCEIATTTYYNFLKILAFDNLEEFTSIRVKIDNINKYCHEIMTLLKESLDGRSKKLAFNVTESNFSINFSEEQNYKLIESIKSHPNIDYHNVEEANLSGEANMTNHT